MFVYSVETLGLPLDKVNVNGGAIALGFVALSLSDFVSAFPYCQYSHPLGATGARQVSHSARFGAELTHKHRLLLDCTSCAAGRARYSSRRCVSYVTLSHQTR